ncbi:MAG: PAS domain S-box protein [Desulfomicrobium escambiense]|nr:PAS domain S-box protein [Desulfomicrobium escambiense]
MPSEDLYRDLVENMHDGIYFVDRERRITYWNKGAERITGYSAAEVVGKSCADNILVHVDAIGRQLCQGLLPAGRRHGRRRAARSRGLPAPQAGAPPAGVGADLAAARRRRQLHRCRRDFHGNQLAPGIAGAGGGAEEAGAGRRVDRSAEPPASGSPTALAAGGAAAQRGRLRPALHGHRPLQAVQRPLRA